jgi:predicted metalloprotease with PDZ domain
MVENHQAARIRPPVRYIVSFPAPRTHYLEIAASLPVERRPGIEIFLPVWTPGSYLVREYARNIEPISALDQHGNRIRFAKTRKNRWRISTGEDDEVQFRYRVYCREMSVRTNWVEESFALINGAPTFVAIVEDVPRPYEIRFELPANWNSSITGLPKGSEPHSYVAESYDELIDSPVLCGNPSIYTFEVDGIPHLLANEGEAGVWDGPRSAAATEKLVRQHREMWGAFPETPPYCQYVFLNLLTESGGGLEHHNSVCLMTSRWATRTPAAWLKWLSLVSHEFFHVWNVKRLRPAELGPFDYENENYTRSLWVAEGITEYYAALTVQRAGLSGVDDYLSALSEMIRLLQTTPGRHVQSLEQASWDAWIKLYRPDENTINTSISYYVKGAVVAWLLDSRIRLSTNGTKSLDDLMRLAFERFSGERGFSPEEFKALAAEVAGVALDDFFRQTVASTDELDYTEALDWFGLRFKPKERGSGGVIGAETRIDSGRLLITKVPRETPAWHSGLTAEDEIIAIDDFRVKADQLGQRLENYVPGDRVSLLIGRRDLVQRVALTLGHRAPTWQLEIRSDASEAQKQNLSRWLGL